jgi:hypothetical protein
MIRALTTPVKPQESNKGFNFFFQMPEFIMKIFNYLHTPLPASVNWVTILISTWDVLKLSSCMQGELTFMIAVDLIPQYSSQLISPNYS